MNLRLELLGRIDGPPISPDSCPRVLAPLPAADLRSIAAAYRTVRLASTRWRYGRPGRFVRRPSSAPWKTVSRTSAYETIRARVSAERSADSTRRHLFATREDRAQAGPAWPVPCRSKRRHAPGR